MPSAKDAILYREAGQDNTTYTALTDQGDQKEFRSAADLWSNKSGYSPVIRPDGLISGCVVTTDAANDQVNVSAGKCYLAGVETDVSAADDEGVTRGVTTDTHRINSITINSSGVIAVVLGTDHTAFATTRGEVGAPPLIPVGSIEIAQVRMTSVAAALITADEIKQVPGTHQERWDYPTWDIVYGEVSNGVLGNAGVDMHSALPNIHTGAIPKKVYANYYEPSFAEIPKSYDFVPPANSHSVASAQVYGATVGSSSASLGQGSFAAKLNDGVTDGILTCLDTNIWFKFYPDRLKDPYILCQGVLGGPPNFPAADNINAKFTISAEDEHLRVSS